MHSARPVLRISASVFSVIRPANPTATSYSAVALNRSSQRYPRSILSSISAIRAMSSSTDTTVASPSQQEESTAASSSSSKSDIYTDGKYRVYTKTGDKGTTSLFNMERRPKSDDYFDALGNTDELNAHLGVARSHAETVLQSPNVPSPQCPPSYLQALQRLDEQLTEIQSRLFDVGAHLATPLRSSNEAQQRRTTFREEHVAQLEEWIDEMEADLPALKNFILPSGGLVATSLHVARAVCRRAERSTVSLVSRGDSDPVVQRYLNRLSDYLFVAARYAAFTSGATETIWKKPREPRSPRSTERDAKK